MNRNAILALMSCLGVASAAACRSPNAADGGTSGGTGRYVPVAPAQFDPAPAHLGSIAFPHQPEGCEYQLPRASAQSIRVVPHGDAAGRVPYPRNVHLTFVGSPATSVVVQWSTGIATISSEVRYGVAGGPLDHVARGYSFTYPGAGPRREHEVHLCGLEPGRRYAFDAGGNASRSAQSTFTTAPDGPGDVRVAVLGDSRSDMNAWGAVATRVAAEQPDAMLFTGDAVADGGSQSMWDAFFAHGAALFATTPSLWADGNHDYISGVYYAQFAFPDNGNPRRYEHWYRLEYGPITVIALNDATIPPSEIRGEETAWLRATLASIDRRRTPWVVTMHHQPLFTSSVGHPPDVLTRRAWGALFDEFHVDMDFAGHVHNYESSLPMRNGAVTDDPHGTRYVTFGGAGAPLYHFRQRASWTQTRESTHGYGIVTANASQFHWEARRTDGTTLDVIDLVR